MKKFVDSYCNYLKKKGIIVSDEQLEICAYGLELIVSAILNIVILVMCSFVLHEESEKLKQEYSQLYSKLSKKQQQLALGMLKLISRCDF
jgi:hypothetical protein